MRNEDIIILLIAAGAAWFIVNKAKGQQTQITAVPTMTSESLAWYLNDIYAQLNAQYA